MTRLALLRHRALWLVSSSALLPALAAPLPFAQSPAGTAPCAPASASAGKLDALSDARDRLGLTTRSDTATGVELVWSHLRDAQENLPQHGDDAPFRIRASRQGDIAHAMLWHVGAPTSHPSSSSYRNFARQHATRLPMLYGSANDGMLHGSSALDGQEKIAYVPRGMIGHLKDLSLPRHAHRSYADGPPFSGDVDWGSAQAPDWRTLLVGTLGAGGTGYFVLDITRPGGTPGPFSAHHAASLVVMDKTARAGDKDGDGPTANTAHAADIGHIFAAPVTEDRHPQKSTQIVRLNNGRWAVVMGNGYNSRNERPVLLLQYLDGDRSLHTLVAATIGENATSNGLSAPRLVDINGDGVPDVAYAGDLRGHLWKFDISAADPHLWGVAFGARPLYSAGQPITAAPAVKANDRGSPGLMVAFGTGRNLTEDDRLDRTSVHTLYAVRDSTRYQLEDGKVRIDTRAGAPQPVEAGQGRLIERTLSDTAIAGAGASAARTFWTMRQHSMEDAHTTRPLDQGWFMHLPVAGERLLAHLALHDGSNLLEVLSEVPASGSPCSPGSAPGSTLPRRYRTFLNIMDGARPRVQIIDANGDGAYDSAEDQGAARMTASPRESRLNSRSHDIRTGSDGIVDRLARLPEQPLRPSWRQLR